MVRNPFAGDKKAGDSLLSGVERIIVNKYTPFIPKQVETYHLTLMTVIWSVLVIICSKLAVSDIRWLWAVSIVVILQYFTDLFDGAIGRYRKTGLIKWGYYMDHLLDYIFLCSVLTGYSFLVDDHFKYLLFFTITIFGAFMVNSFLLFSVTNEFKISYLLIGPTEIRIGFVIINTLLIVYGKTNLGGLLPYVLAFSLIGLCWVVYRTQQHIWNLDMTARIDETHLPLPPTFILFMRYIRNKLRKTLTQKMNK